MKTTLYLFCLLIIFGCKEEAVQYEQYDFTIEGFDWDPDPYKFSSYIRDSVVTTSGAQVASWDFSYIGDVKSTHILWDGERGPSRTITQEEKDAFLLFQPKNAISHILDQAQSHQVIIINEGHHMPQHRVFTTQLLAGLKAQGYTHLGLETYFGTPKSDSTMVADGFPSLTSGYYTKEPQFGNLLREALKEGFKIFGYESQGHEDGKGREINQARNIEAYLEKHPGEKVLIHCGFDHGYEGDMNNQWEKAMAGRLTEYTAIDPLTINQVLYPEKSKREYENPFYQLTDVEEPSIFIDNEENVFGEYRPGAHFDLAVFHPRSHEIGRPSWLIHEDRKEVAFSFAEAEIACPCLVLAYKEGDKIGSAVPYDIQETATKEVSLVLDNDKYEIIIWNEAGKALKTSL